MLKLKTSHRNAKIDTVGTKMTPRNKERNSLKLKEMDDSYIAKNLSLPAVQYDEQQINERALIEK